MPDADLSFSVLDRDTAERFQRLRAELGVESFGMNLIVLAPRQRGRIHAHERQEEVYLVLEGELMLFVDGVAHVLGPDRVVRVGPGVRRQLVNAGPARLVLLALGGAGDHVGRDGDGMGVVGRGRAGAPAAGRARARGPARRLSAPLRRAAGWAAPSAAGTLAIACSMSSSEMSRCVTARTTPARTVGESRTPASRSRRSSASGELSPSAPTSSCTKLVWTRSRSTGRPGGQPPASEALCVLVVLGKSLDVVLEGKERGRGDDPGLAHRTAEAVLLDARTNHQLV